MNLSVVYNPYKLIKRLALELNRKRRFAKLRNAPGINSKPGHLNSLEWLEIICNGRLIKANPAIFDIGNNTGTWTLLAKSILASAIVYTQFFDIANYLAGFKFQLFALGNNTPVGTELNQIDVLFKCLT